MPVKLQRIKFTDNLSHEKREMFRAAVKSIGTVTKEKLVDNLVRENYVPQVYAGGVLDNIGGAMFDYMELGHSVQIPGLGTLQLVVNSKATESEKDCNAQCVKGVKIALTPSAEIKQRLAALTFVMTNATANGESEPAEGEVNTGTTKYRITYKFADDTEDDQEYEAGATIVPPENTSGYEWPDTLPTTMPEQNLTVTEVETQQLPGGY